MSKSLIESGLIHPLRYLRTRPFAREAIKVWAKTEGRRVLPTMATVQALTSLVMEAFNALPFDQRRAVTDDGLGTGDLTCEGSLALYVGRFVAHGRNVFVLTSELVELLTKTDLAGVRFGDVQFPFRVFYVSFGAGVPLSLPGPANVIDGAYISLGDTGTLEVLVTSRRLADRYRAREWPRNRDRYFYVPLQFNGDREATFETAFERAVATNEIPTLPRPISPIDYDELAREAGFTGKVIGPSSAKREAEAAETRAGLNAARETLALVINSLIWLSLTTDRSGEPLGAPSWPADAPRDLVERVSAKRGAARGRARAELLELGFSEIRIAGSAYPSRDAGHPGTGDIAPHWRRGHWRRQPYGPGRAEVRLCWIKPTFVGSLQETDNVRGHLYRVGPALGSPGGS